MELMMPLRIIELYAHCIYPQKKMLGLAYYASKLRCYLHNQQPVCLSLVVPCPQA